MRELSQRLVFIDETSVKTNMTRLRGGSPVGERLYGVAPFGRWQTQTFIAGLSSNDVIAPWGIPGAMNRKAFDTYIETQLAPALEPGTVVILDNLITHKGPKPSRRYSSADGRTAEWALRAVNRQATCGNKVG